MNLQELISSGKLELYVAGVLSEREMADIGILAQEHPEVASEVQNIERAMVEFLSPQEFRLTETEKETQIEAILGRIHQEPQIYLHTNGAANGNAAGSAPVRSIPSRGISRWAVAALVVGLIAASGLSVWFGSRYARLAPEAETLRTQYKDLANAQNQYQDQMGHLQQQVSLMRNILTKRVQLSTVAGNKITSADNYMLVYWNPETKKLLLVDAHLPELSAQQQYQLWALYDNKPIDAGVFDTKDLAISSSFQKDIPNAQAFAVTVEPKGGSKSPTLSNLCMVGKL
jgi:anti-sigma-K factor RskA